ncbi:hypothetical protein A9Q99_18120 [Gammaproteobacteria bacterium 45_16_T64]|nr:hypothetical protein A9Q99_18120 [Gammaproteobacteria bacterium 45_16_T64]
MLFFTLPLSGCGAGTTKYDWSYGVNISNEQFENQTLSIGESPSNFRFFSYGSPNYAAHNILSDGTLISIKTIGNYNARPRTFNQTTGISYDYGTTSLGVEVTQHDINNEVIWTRSENEISSFLGDFSSIRFFHSDSDNKLITTLNTDMIMLSGDGDYMTSSDIIGSNTDCNSIDRVKFLSDESILALCKSDSQLISYHLDSELNILDTFSTAISPFSTQTSYVLSSDSIYLYYDQTIKKYSYSGDIHWSIETTGKYQKLYMQNGTLLSLSHEQDTNIATLQKIDDSGVVEWKYQSGTLQSQDAKLLVSEHDLLLTYKDILSGFGLDTSTHEIGTISSVTKNHLLSNDGKLIKQVVSDKEATLYANFFGYFGKFVTDAGVVNTRDYLVVDSTLILLSDYLSTDLVGDEADNSPNRALLTGYSLNE